MLTLVCAAPATGAYTCQNSASIDDTDGIIGDLKIGVFQMGTNVCYANLGVGSDNVIPSGSRIAGLETGSGTGSPNGSILRPFQTTTATNSILSSTAMTMPTVTLTANAHFVTGAQIAITGCSAGIPNGTYIAKKITQTTFTVDPPLGTPPVGSCTTGVVTPAPALFPLINIAGSARTNLATNITVERVSFDVSGYNVINNDNGFVQAKFCSHCNFVNNTVSTLQTVCGTTRSAQIGIGVIYTDSDGEISGNKISCTGSGIVVGMDGYGATDSFGLSRLPDGVGPLVKDNKVFDIGLGAQKGGTGDAIRIQGPDTFFSATVTTTSLPAFTYWDQFIRYFLNGTTLVHLPVLNGQPPYGTVQTITDGPIPTRYGVSLNSIGAGAVDAQVFPAQVRTGTAPTGVSGSTIKLDSGASASDGAYSGLGIYITGCAQLLTIISYVGGTQVATVDQAWSGTGCTPTTSVGYTIINIVNQITSSGIASGSANPTAVGSATCSASASPRAVTFIGGGGSGTVGTITFPGTTPYGTVTITNPGSGYSSIPTQATIANCTGTFTFTGTQLAPVLTPGQVFVIKAQLGAKVYTNDNVSWIASKATNHNSAYTIVPSDTGNCTYLGGTSTSSTYTFPQAGGVSANSYNFGMGGEYCIANLSAGTGVLTVSASGTSLINPSNGVGSTSFTLSPGTLAMPSLAFIRTDGRDYYVCGTSLTIIFSISGTNLQNQCPGGVSTAAAFPLPFTPHPDLPMLVTGNQSWNIHSHLNEDGSSGNCIHFYHTRFGTASGNNCRNSDYSFVRATNADYIAFIGNQGTNSGEVCGYSEFNSQYTTFADNNFNGCAKRGIESPANYTFTPTAAGNGKLTVIHHNVISNVSKTASNSTTGTNIGGFCIKSEGYTLIDHNILDHCSTGIQVGNGRFVQQVVVDHNLITDSAGLFPYTALTSSIGTQIGIGIETANPSFITGIVIDGNTIDLNGVSPDHFIATTVNGEFRAAGPSAGVLVRNQNISFANIGTPDDGSLVYSSDAKPTGGFGTACSGGSNQGAFVQRRNGIWICP